MKIHELFSESSGWCQGTLARNASGQPTKTFMSNACSWCLVGALEKCYSGTQRDEARQKISAELTARQIRLNIVSWNDHAEREWEEVRDLCKELDV